MSGGIVECGPQRITYTGIAVGGTGSYVAANPLGAPASSLSCTMTGGGTAFPNGAITYYFATFYSATGETSRGTSAGQVTNGTGGTANGSLTSIPTGPTGTVGRRVYRAKNVGSAAGPFHRVVDIANNSATTHTDNLTDASLGDQPPSTDTTGQEPTAAGSTTLRVADLSQFLSAGGWVSVGEQVLSYTGRAASSGTGNLTGIPASGPGSITAPISVGSEVKTLPHLTGCSGIVYPLVNGDPVNIVVVVNDAAAQAALAARVGGDGVSEMFISDGTIGITEATARANAELSLRKDPLETVTFTSRDPSMQSGRDVTLTITSPAISGTFKIQRVTITELGLQGPTGFLFPLRQVDASSRRYSFEDLLRRLKAGG
jgi:hypothetical protein